MKTGDIDYKRAEKYLNQANWNEELAVKFFHDIHPNYIPHYIIKINHDLINKEYKDLKSDIKKENSDKELNNIFFNGNKNNKDLNSDIKEENIEKNPNKYLEINIDETLIKYSYKSILNKKYLEILSNNIKSIQKIFITFIKSLRNLGGVIIIFNEGSFNRLINHIKNINEKNIDKNIIKKFVIFPLLNDCPLGKEFVKKLTILSFPAYIFCKYKDDKIIYVTDKMEGAFETSFFVDCIKKDIPTKNEIDLFNQKNNEINENNKKVININEINEKNEYNKHVDNKKENNDDKKSEELINKLLREDVLNYAKNIENIFERYNIIHEKNNKNINNKYFIDKDLDIDLSSEIIIFGKKEFNNNNEKKDNQFDRNEDDKKVNNKEDDKKINNNKEKKEGYNYNNYNFDYNQNNLNNKNNLREPIIKNEKNENKKKELNESNFNLLDNDKNLEDSINNLSDGQILEKREKEMRELERQQEEKEKKEEEEKRKEQEEEKRIKKLNKKYEYESNIAKMILADEPDEKNPDVCRIVFRFPDGEKSIERKFLKNDKIAVLYDYVKSIGREIFIEPDANDFDILCLDFPPKNLESKKNNTLLEEGLFPNSVLQIREK